MVIAMQNNSDEPAFPLPISRTQPDQKGMSLRDWFAGMAIGAPCMKEIRIDSLEDFENVAADCYAIADAMIAARKRFG